MENITDLLTSIPNKNNVVLIIKKISDIDELTKLIIYLIDIERNHLIDPYYLSTQEIIAQGPLLLYEHVDMPQCDEVEIVISNNLYEIINYLLDCDITIIKVDSDFMTFELDDM